MDLFEIFITSFVALFVIVDPLGSAAVFTSLMNKASKSEATKVAIKAVLIATILLILFGFFGMWLLSKLSVSLGAFKVAGGLLLFVSSFRMIMGYHDPDQLESGAGVYKDLSSIAVFPLAIPLLAGPGCMVAMVLLMTSQSVMIEKGIVISALVVVEFIALIAMLGAKQIVGLLGQTGNSIIARVMGVLLAAMAVQFVADGVLALIQI